MILAMHFIALCTYNTDSIFMFPLLTTHKLKISHLRGIVWLYRGWKWLMQCLMSPYFKAEMGRRDHLITRDVENEFQEVLENGLQSQNKSLLCIINKTFFKQKYIYMYITHTYMHTHTPTHTAF